MIQNELKQMGFHVIESIAEKAKGDQYVVLGMSPSITYTMLQDGFDLLQQGARLILLNRDLLCPHPKALLIDTGSLARIFEHPEITRKAEVVGKPSSWMQQVISEKIGANKDEAVIVGDSVASDMAIGRAIGVDTILVYSGITSKGDVDRRKVKPDQTVDSIATIYHTIKEQSYV